MMSDSTSTMDGTLPVRALPRVQGYSTAWWGVATVIATEAMIFIGLLATYFFLRAASKEWPLGGIELPELTQTSIYSVVLIGSSIPVIRLRCPPAECPSTASFAVSKPNSFAC